MQQRFLAPLFLTLSSSSLSSVLGFQLRPPQTTYSSPSRVFLSASTSSTTDTLTDTEVQTLFNLLADSTILYDPSRGTCCRNRCSGCTYLDPAGNFLFDEYTTNNTSEVDSRGWLAPYVNVDFGERIQTSKWSTLLFPPVSSDDSDDDKAAKKKKEVERKEFTTLLEQQLSSSSSVSPLAIQALWNILSPSVGYPRLTSTEIIRAIKGMEGAKSEMGGAVTYDTFAKNLLAAGDQIQQLGGLSDGDDESNVVDYDAMEKEELLDVCVERGMKTNFPKMKRIIIEELRFFDANGRQGKRHPVKNTLS
mmetsp:Transcript_21446/g.32758  ORF Transcript_21446/g.32758 Transcript_21446/m.32758 type:complete len:306 (+) Transcript_21446:57-974(+)